MSNSNCENPTTSETSTRDDLEHRPTNALTIDTQKIVDAATRIEIRDYARSRIYTNSLLRIEFKMHELEERIIVGRQLLAVGEGDPIKIHEYVTTASTIYNRHLSKMLKLSHINTKTKSPPVLPITFTVQETSELYWTLVQFGRIESIVAQVEHGLKENVSRLMEKMAGAQPEVCDAISKAVKLLDVTLRQWRPEAEAAVRGRCMAIQSMISAEVMGIDERDGFVRAQKDGGVGVEETDSTQNSSAEMIVQE